MASASLRPPPREARPLDGFSQIMRQGVPLAVHIRYSDSDFGSSGPYVADTFGRVPSYLCVLQLHDYPNSNAWRDGRHFDAPELPANSLFVLDLRHDWHG